MEYYKQILQEKPIYEVVGSCLGNEKQDELYAMVCMPTMIEFISWVLKEAQKSKKQRLYFLARDGYQMYLTAQKLCEIKNISIECRYLKVSRYAMRMPEYHLLKEQCVEHICVGGIDVTTRRIMRRAGLDEKLAKKFLPQKNDTQILNYQEVMQLKEELRQNDEFLERVYEVSKKTYESAIGYLKQEGLFDDINFALVDSGWVGTLQQTISHLIGRPNLEGYYFGIYQIPKGMSKEQYHSYYFGWKWGLKRKVGFSNCLFEAIFTSTEGMTLGYEKKGNVYIPISDFLENPNKKQIEHNCALLEEYMTVYGKWIHGGVGFQRKIANGSYEESVRFTERLLQKFMGYPTTLEVEAYGNLLFSDDVLEGNLKKVAADLTIEDIHTQRFLNKALIMLGIKKEEIHESAWIEGSIVKIGNHIRENLFHAKLYKYFVYIRKLWK